jgi:hypothetical protein
MEVMENGCTFSSFWEGFRAKFTLKVLTPSLLDYPLVTYYSTLSYPYFIPTDPYICGSYVAYQGQRCRSGQQGREGKEEKGC